MVLREVGQLYQQLYPLSFVGHSPQYQAAQRFTQLAVVEVQDLQELLVREGNRAQGGQLGLNVVQRLEQERYSVRERSKAGQLDGPLSCDHNYIVNVLA